MIQQMIDVIISQDNEQMGAYMIEVYSDEKGEGGR